MVHYKIRNLEFFSTLFCGPQIWDLHIEFIFNFYQVSLFSFGAIQFARGFRVSRDKLFIVKSCVLFTCDNADGPVILQENPWTMGYRGLDGVGHFGFVGLNLQRHNFA